MAASRCATCGREEFLPYRCKLCAQPHCLDHRLPENHGCAGLQGYRAKAREERVFGLQTPGDDVRVKVRKPFPGAGLVDKVVGFTQRGVTHLLLAAVLLTFAGQVLGGILLGMVAGIGAGAGFEVVKCALALGTCPPFGAEYYGLAAKPWSIVTNIFAHDGLLHLFFNALFLYFFGTEMEHRVGRRTVLHLFLAGGLVAAIGQVVLFPGAVLGASGALMALLGTLTVLAPTMRVIIFIVPAPLWALTLLFVMLDLSGVISPAGRVANLAHLLGLAVGLAYGLHLKRRGVMPKVARSWASQRRF
jgi:uncharacterized protein